MTDGKVFFAHNFPPTVFTLLSIGLTVACACLIVRMNKYFDRSLKDEVCRIKTIFLVFTVSYLTRATAYFVLPRVNASNITEGLIFHVGFNFCDVIPLTIVMIFHLMKIKPVVDDSNDSLLETQSSLSAQSMQLLKNSMLENDPEFADVLIMNKELIESRDTSELEEEKGEQNTNLGTDSRSSRQDEELSSSGDEISVPTRSLASTLGESSSEEGVVKITYPYVEN